MLEFLFSKRTQLVGIYIQVKTLVSVHRHPIVSERERAKEMNSSSLLAFVPLSNESYENQVCRWHELLVHWSWAIGYMSVPCCHRCSAPESGNKQKTNEPPTGGFSEFLTQSVRSTWKRWENGITREREDDLFTCDAVLCTDAKKGRREK
jgi:hypothetical protein